ncbi:MAG: bifunctional oligoribonuclease/PAP phosphatase NrnA [Patescibacteria group bacterium]|jgi:phosphoesterase RecJ-like protein
MHAATVIHKHIQKAHKILIVPHQNPDGDAIGSAAAFHEYARSLGREAQIFCVTPPNPKLSFVHHSAPIYSDPAIFKDPSIDTIVTLDSGDLRYSGIAELVKGHRATIINIDHHASNENYGDINLVIPTAASTTEILFRFFRHNSIRISQKMATSLLTGLSTDTSNFTNAATTGDALRAGGELILAGGNFNLITSNTLKNKSIGSLRLWGKAFSRLTKDERLNLTHTYVTQADIKELGVSESEYEGISNFLNNLENTSITLLLSETADGKIKGSLRTTKNDVDVSAIAKKFNGGGHKKAAGFTVDGTLEEVLGKILTA